jgi:hypothetical protein
VNTTLEISAHVIGGPETYPRNWGPRTQEIATEPGSWTSVTLDCATTARLWLHVEFTNWTSLGAGWLSATVALSDVNGWTIGRRPTLIYDRPYDIPMVTSFHVPSEDCVFALSVRATGRVLPT